MKYLKILFIVLFVVSCSESKNDNWEDVTTKKADEKIVLFLGDSLTAGYGLEKESAFPALIQEKLDQDNKNYTVRNAGVSGATSADLLSSLNWSLQSDIYLVFLCIGANDGLRGKKVKDIKQNIKKIIEACHAKNLKVVMAGMMLPPNYGQEYRTHFHQIYSELSSEHSLELMPFLLKDVAGISSLNILDAIHPNEKGHKIVAENVYQFLMERKLLP